MEKVVNAATGEVTERPYVPGPPSPPQIRVPSIYASAGFPVVDGALASIEIAAQLQGAFYYDGWFMVGFADELPEPYLVFVQTDIPAKIEQFKEPGSLELIFSDPLTGDPVEPGRIDIQILR